MQRCEAVGKFAFEHGFERAPAILKNVVMNHNETKRISFHRCFDTHLQFLFDGPKVGLRLLGFRRSGHTFYNYKPKTVE
jgi:hypothetical protein